jgi:hypothetical protein
MERAEGPFQSEELLAGALLGGSHIQFR